LSAKKILLAYGTRPELIKLAPVLFELKKRKGVHLTILNTGQHKEMVDELEAFFAIRADVYFKVMTANQNLNLTLSKITEKSAELLSRLKPDLIVVQGDTTTVLALGISGFYAGISVAHVEAGLRSFDLKNPYPEEFNRRVISLLATYHFTPTANASQNLIREGVSKESITLTGNTVVDTMNLIVKKGDRIQTEASGKLKKILITAHRRENHGKGIAAICTAVKNVLKKHKGVAFIWPVHPNPNVENVVQRLLGNTRGVTLCKPLSYANLLREMKESFLIWTDSGGIQEEAPSLKKPVLILRTVTERPEVVKSGFGILTGTDAKRIVSKTSALLSNKELYKKMTGGKNPFGDGKAAKRIADVVLKKAN